MEQKELNKILKLHEKWLNREPDGKKANLQNADLSFTNLENVNLQYANLKGANLKYSNLKWANLFSANLEKANLEGANLVYANLYKAFLYGTNLEGADIQETNLHYAILKNANLAFTNLKNAYYQNANLLDAKNIPYIPMACPSKGSFTAWKKIYFYENNSYYYENNCYYLIELLIPEDAKRSSATSNKCRCDKAKVISITNHKTNKKIDSIVNYKYCETMYKVGEFVYPDSFDENRWNECSHGIHFFINKEEALCY